MRKILLFSVFWVLFSTFPVKAAKEFYVKDVVDYQFDNNGNSTITQHLSLTNKTAHYYASEYQLELNGENPQNISGRDSSGLLRISTIPKDASTTVITVNFNDIVVGLDNTLNFSLKYNGKPALHNGQVWEITLPKLGNPEMIDDYTLNLIVPPNFGKPAFISPPPNTSNNNHYSFTKDQVSKLGIVAAFGNFQTYDFKLQYHIVGSSTIALPPDTPYQRVFYDSIDPRPDSLTTDTDGNWLATYHLKNNQPLNIKAVGQAHIFAEPISNLGTSTKSDLDKYLQATPYWPHLSEQFKTPEAIYNYVVKTLSYDYSGISSRKGALEALSDPTSSVCTEFTDLFIALARTSGIPAREINGYAYTTDTKLRPLNVLHAWPEYWNKNNQSWISVDPTWGNTTGGVDYFHKLDFNHFAFAIHGLSDSSPKAASFHEVYYSSYREYPPQKLAFKWHNPLFIIPFIPLTFTLTYTNPNLQAVYNNPVTLPPLAQTNISTKFTYNHPFDFSPQSFPILIGGQSQTYNIPKQLFLPWQITLAIFVSLIIIGLAVLASKAWSLYFQKLRGSDSVRG